MDVTSAADFLGLTKDAVRKRASRGTLPARKTGGRWQVGVILDRSVTGDQPDTARSGDSIDQQPENARLQLEAIRDEWLQPLIDQIAEQAEEIGRLRAKIEVLETGTSESPERVSATEDDRDVIAVDAAAPSPESGTWQRFRRWLAGGE